MKEFGFIAFIVIFQVLHSSAFRFSVKKALKVKKPTEIKIARRNDVRMSSTGWKIGIVGATGAVGEELLSVLEKRSFPASEVHLFASDKSAGKSVESGVYGSLVLEPFSFDVASKLDLVLLAVGGDFSIEWAEKLAAAGVLVIDNSSAFRYKDGVPLVIPEINIAAAKGKKLISNPNCTTAIALMALWPIHQKYKIKKAIISTYQAASGAGAPGMQELKDGMEAVVNGKEVINKIFAHPLPYNIIPHIDVFQPNLYTKEEMKVAWEAKKIMDAPELRVSCTAVRIPTLRAHSEAITLETTEKINADDVREILRHAPGVKVVDDPSKKLYPMPLTATKQWDIEVGRIRENDVFGEYGLDLFVSGDQVLFFIYLIVFIYLFFI
jgi:aspartate-semialdehyde dehydrogenase